MTTPTGGQLNAADRKNEADGRDSLTKFANDQVGMDEELKLPINKERLHKGVAAIRSEINRQFADLTAEFSQIQKEHEEEKIDFDN